MAAFFCVVAPGLAEWRVDYVLEIPLCAGCIWAQWLLGRWLRPKGASWVGALLAALAIASALLIKQSALLVLLGPALWAVVVGLQERQRRWQLLASFGLVLALVAPWLGHNLSPPLVAPTAPRWSPQSEKATPMPRPWRAGFGIPAGCLA